MLHLVNLHATCFHARFLLGSFFVPENGGDIFLRNAGYFQRTTRRYIPEGNHRYENLKSYNFKLVRLKGIISLLSTFSNKFWQELIAYFPLIRH
jgi:hypothetical protein